VVRKRGRKSDGENGVRAAAGVKNGAPATIAVSVDQIIDR
jgi:hypothetical protein